MGIFTFVRVRIKERLHLRQIILNGSSIEQKTRRVTKVYFPIIPISDHEYTRQMGSEMYHNVRKTLTYVPEPVVV